MANNRDKDLCNEILSQVINEATTYISKIEKVAVNKEFESSRSYALCTNIADEVAQAIQKKYELTAKEIDTCKHDAVKGCQKANIDAGNRETLMKEGVIHSALLLCKKQGVYPYFISKLAAAALYDHAQDQSSKTYQIIMTHGLKAAIKDIFSFNNEPELAYLIVGAYQTIISGQFFNDNQERIEIVKTAFEVAFENEAVYGGCPQCLIKSFLTITNKDDEKSQHMFKSASALSGGIACCNDSACGAYIGAMMVIGSCLGRELKDLDDENGETGEKGNDIGRIVHDKFKETFGTLICKEIHKNIFGREFDFKYDEQLEAFRDAGAHEDKCPMVVGIANSWVCGALYDEGLAANNLKP